MTHGEASRGSSSTFFINPRTMEDFREELLQDISRRIRHLKSQQGWESSARGSARYAFAIREFEELWRFWNEISIKRKP